MDAEKGDDNLVNRGMSREEPVHYFKLVNITLSCKICGGDQYHTYRIHEEIP
jgi:hypothetical protein